MLETEHAATLPAAQPATPSLPLRSGEWWIEQIIRGAGISTIFIIGLIFLFLLREGLPAFVRVSPLNLLGLRWYPIEEMYGLLPLLVGSLLVTVGAVVIAVPLGLITSIYLGEIAPMWQREILKPLIEVLAGIPSIVLGFLGWVALAPLVQQAGAPTGLTAFTGSLILAYMSLPTIISISEDALYAVPKEYRYASLAIGATEWQTIWRVVIPAARSGIVIATVLGIGRAIGGDDGDRQCRQHPRAQLWTVLPAGTHDDGDDCRRDGRSRPRRLALPDALRHRDCALPHHIRHQLAG